MYKIITCDKNCSLIIHDSVFYLHVDANAEAVQADQFMRVS